jgi:predicted transcriptional regulator
MLEQEIKEYLKEKGLKQSDIYNKLWISKQNFYKTIRTKNFDNPTLNKILDFLGLKIFIFLKKKNEKTKKDFL